MLYRSLDLERAGGVTIDLLKLGARLAQGSVQIGLSFIPGAAALGKIVEELQKLGTENLSQSALDDAIRREHTKIHIEQVRFLEQFQAKFQLLVQTHITPGRLVVFVDDLDRCLPEKAIQVLEAIKLFCDAPHCVFILGLDQAVIARGVQIRYKDFTQSTAAPQAHPIDGQKYLEKIIQLPFTLPRIEPEDMGPFVQGLATEWEYPECPRVFALGLGDNPRQVKRTVNVFHLLSRLRVERKLERSIQPVRLAKVVVIQSVAQDLYRELQHQPGLLRDIENYYRQAVKEKGGGEALEAEAHVRLSPAEGSPPQAQLPEGLLRLLAQTPAVARIFTMHPREEPEANFWDQTPEALKPYFTLARRAELPPVIQAETLRLLIEPQMVRIPAGLFRMGSSGGQAAQAVKDGADKDYIQREQPQHQVELSEYWIGKYPVTCREYQAFIAEEGYQPPRGWNGSQFPEGKGDHPVVNVSWQDADNDCRWLRKKTDKPYCLPSEAQWEKAARGVDGRVYPWGDAFDPHKANTREADINGTTPVGQFSPQGDSPFGCADMSGNVWEWCLDWYEEKIYAQRAQGSAPAVDPVNLNPGSWRVVRGGSWYSYRYYARCAYRDRDVRDLFSSDLGFRVALSPKKVLES
jgi:formylglycine-generating enzyme required for sulfatase activity